MSSETDPHIDSIRYSLETEVPDEDIDGNQSDSDSDGDDEEDKIEFIPITNLLRNRKKKDTVSNYLETYSVPHHRRCVCTLLNPFKSHCKFLFRKNFGQTFY